MKIVIVSSLFPPESRGGAELAAYRMAQMLQKTAHEIVVVTSAASDKPRYSEEKQGALTIIRYRPRHVGDVRKLSMYSCLRRVFFHLADSVNVSSALRFRKILQTQKPDVVVTHGLKGLGYLLPRVAKMCGIPYVHVLHDVQLIEPSGIAEPEVKKTGVRRLWSFFTAAIFGSPSAVVFPSQWLLALSRQWGFFKTSKLAHLSNPLQTQAVVRARPIRTFLFLGQLEVHKGIKDVLGAMELVDKDCELLVVGDGSLTASVTDAAKKDVRIRYLGRRQGVQLADAWSLADCVIVPSRCAENAPNVIQEAIAHGLPVIATRVGGIPEMIEEGVTGFLFSSGDVDALQKQMSALLGTMVKDEVRERMRIQAATWEGEQYISKFEELIGSI